MPMTKRLLPMFSCEPHQIDARFETLLLCVRGWERHFLLGIIVVFCRFLAPCCRLYEGSVVCDSRGTRSRRLHRPHLLATPTWASYVQDERRSEMQRSWPNFSWRPPLLVDRLYERLSIECLLAGYHNVIFRTACRLYRGDNVRCSWLRKESVDLTWGVWDACTGSKWGSSKTYRQSVLVRGRL